MPTYTDIKPRELKPALLELDGISRASIEAHYRLYQGYVAKRNEILAQLEAVDRSGANQVYSELRALKVELSFAIGGIKNHEIYFAHLGGAGGDPTGAIDGLIRRDFGSVDAWRDDLKATGIAGRGWAWTAYDWDEHRLFNYIGDAQNTLPGLERDSARRARRLRARLLPRLPDRPWRVHRRVLRESRLERRERLDRHVRHPGRVASPRARERPHHRRGLPDRVDPVRRRRRLGSCAARTFASRAAATSAPRTCGEPTGGGSACRSRSSMSPRASSRRSSA